MISDRALHDMHRDGIITMYNIAVVVKERLGNVVVRRAPGAEPVGTFGGMLTGGLIGLLGGPIGADLRSDYGRRTRRLQEALDRSKAAHAPTVA
jgi:hypothetical protein